MEFISTKNMKNEDAPKGQVLVQYLEPSWGYYSVEFAIGYFDNPNYYINSNHGGGWKLWLNGNKIKVIGYALLPEKMENPFDGRTQKEIYEEYGTHHPNLGNVGI